jgi:hypothetical protein
MYQADPPILLSLSQYIDFLIAFNGKTRYQAEKIARKAYIEQYGKTPEEHQEEHRKAWENMDWGKSVLFDIHGKCKDDK